MSSFAIVGLIDAEQHTVTAASMTDVPAAVHQLFPAATAEVSAQIDSLASSFDAAEALGILISLMPSTEQEQP